jgi:hypothetical protein
VNKLSEQNEGNPFELEKGLDSPQITRDLPETTWDTLVWQAFRVAVEISDSKKDVFRLMNDWNDGNDPKLSQKALDKKVLWALLNFDTKFKGK